MSTVYTLYFTLYTPHFTLYLYIYLACLSVCLYPINVKTAEPNGSKFCVRPNMAPGKVYELSKFQKFASIH